MLIELTISNFAIIDHLRLPFGAHLNVFTGETGAGKSIIVDAIAALVGERTTAEVVRAGSERASVEGVFDVATLVRANRRATTLDTRRQREGDTPRLDEGESEAETLADLLAELGIEVEDGTLILLREISRSGRGITRINGRAVPLSALQRIAAHLIDIHGQMAHLAILRPEQHIYYLDRYASTVDLRRQVAELVGVWRGVRREYDRLQRDEREIERRIELLKYQVEEIAAARLQPGELDELERERRMLTNAERLTELCAVAHAALAGEDEGESGGALDALANAQRALSDLLRLEDSLREQANTLEQTLFLAQDVALAVRSYQEEVAADPERLAEVEERLDLIAKLRRKYGATIEDMLTFAEEASAELEELSHREERAASLLGEEQRLRERIGAAAGQLSLRRQQAAAQLSAAMERELDDLNMQRARFQVQITQQVSPEGAVVAGAEGIARGTYAFTATGIDRVEFVIAPNPGEPFKPLARIASGGETSRLMLALKTILSLADAVPILIFDEIDAGISGRSGQVVGEKLWQLGQSHQVLCVTHLAQIAAIGDAHFHVSKAVQGDRTTTRVRQLTTRERVEEISQMLGGASTRAAQANASDLIQRAQEWQGLYLAGQGA
jgi:DNA repair protein RecN (Recombination protein N)